MRVHAHTLFTQARVFTHVHACMANVANWLASYLPFTLNLNATILVTPFFPYRALAAHQGVAKRLNRRGSGINKPNTGASY